MKRLSEIPVHFNKFKGQKWPNSSNVTLLVKAMEYIFVQ